MKKTILTTIFCICVPLFILGSASDDSLKQEIRKPLRFSGTKIYCENTLLSKTEVYSLLSVSPALIEQYEKGINLTKTGTTLYIVGGVMAIGGVGLSLYGLFTSPTNYTDYGTSITDYNSEYYAGLIFCIIGEIIFDAGIISKMVGKTSIRKSINNYNETLKSSGYTPGSVYYQVGFLDNGRIGLKLTF